MKVRIEHVYANGYRRVEVKDVKHKTLDGALDASTAREENMAEATITRLDLPNHSYYDYANQAYVTNGAYVRCHHPETMDCKCFGKINEDKPVTDWTEVH